MPIKYLTCPDGVQIEKSKCLDSNTYGCRMKRRCAPRQYLTRISQDRIWKGQPSVTMLIQGTMASFLKLTEDYSVSPGQRAFLLHGTNVHQALESSGDDLSLLEEKLEMNDITGIADTLQEENGEILLIDHKTSGSYKIAKALGLFTYDMKTNEVYKSGPRKGEPKTVKGLNFGIDKIDMDDWVLQLNAYRLMYLEKGFKVDKLFIFAVVRDGGSRSALSRGIGNNIYMIPVRMMNDEVVRDYFDDKKKKLLLALEKGFWEEPCNEVENWAGNKCRKYCEVWEHCPMGKLIHDQKDEEEEDMPVGYTGKVRIQNGGRIKLGELITNERGNQQAIEYSYFILEPKTPEIKEKTRLIKEFEDAFGKEPTLIEAMLPWGLSPNNVEEILGTEDTPEPNFESVFPQNYYRTSHKSGLTLCSNARMPLGQAKCIDKKYTNDMLEIIQTRQIKNPKNPQADREECIVKCDMEECPFRLAEPAQCVPTAFLNVMIPKINSMDTWTIKTGSFNSISNINGFLTMSAFMLYKAGVYSVAGMPIKLERRPQKMNHAGTIKEHYPIFVESQQGINISKFLEMSTKSKEDVKVYLGLEMPKMLEAGDSLPAAEDSGLTELASANLTIDGETGEVIEQTTEASPTTPPIIPESNPNDGPQGLDISMFDGVTRKLATTMKTSYSNMVKFSSQTYKEPFDALVDFDKALNDPEYQTQFNEKLSTWLASFDQANLL